MYILSYKYTRVNCTYVLRAYRYHIYLMNIYYNLFNRK